MEFTIKSAYWHPVDVSVGDVIDLDENSDWEDWHEVNTESNARKFVVTSIINVSICDTTEVHGICHEVSQ